MTEIDLTLFGEAARYKISDIKKQVESKTFLINDRALKTLREADRHDLTDPDLEVSWRSDLDL